MEKNLFLGVDFGISRISFVTNVGIKKTFYDLPVAYKDIFIKGKYNFQKDPYLVIDRSLPEPENITAICDNIVKEYFVKNLDPSFRAVANCVISVSGGMPTLVCDILLLSFKRYFKVTEVISSALAAAYSFNSISRALIVDIGANSVDFCRFSGAMPEKGDYSLIYKAGNFIESRLFNLLNEKLDLTPDSIRRLNINSYIEKYGTVDDKVINSKLNIKIIQDSKLHIYNLLPEMKISCLLILKDIVEEIKSLVNSYHIEFKHDISQNIIFCGRGSLIKGINNNIINCLNKEKTGIYRATNISDPVYVSAIGALNLARDKFIYKL